MNDKIKEEFNRILIPDDIHQRANKGIQIAKSEMTQRKENYFTIIPVAVSLVIVTMGGYSFINHQTKHSQSVPLVKNDTSSRALIIPPLLSKDDTTQMKDMIALIVYKGKIYTQSATRVDSQNVKNLVGEKLGRTKFGIDEWSKQDDYAVEFASNIGEADVYSVKGYDQNFRIMSFVENEGEIFAEFYDSLNGITIKDGQDVFGKLQIKGKIVDAEYRDYTDWNNSIENYHPIKDMEIINNFVNAMDQSRPFTPENVEKTIGDFRNEAHFKELVFKLTDGTIVKFSIIKDGYISYGNPSVYFKIEKDVFTKLWEQLDK